MLLLFQKESCPYCAKVRLALTNLQLSFVSINSKSGYPARDIQIKLGGIDQVPFLVDIDRGVLMYESDDIVAYLEKTYGK
ncbi:MAG: glutathione S-transferase N-terminal domain-containing protein [Candidatus Abawacabacteria bacterium]|nr:glutathione S-transferase N-terminal domain-containing protein [Candidatus Abawacabacteria bacterium]